MPFIQPLPEWNKPGTEPPQSKKDEGWAAGDKPPADWLNWLSYRAHQALKELQQNAVHKDDQAAIADATTTTKGIVMLEDSISSISTTKAATPNSVKKVNDVVAAHSADYVKHPAFAVATGAANNYVITLNPAPTAYEDGMGIAVAINVDSTGASTLNVNGLGAIPIKKSNGTDVTNLKANGIYTLRYLSGNFILQGEGGSGNALASDLLSGKTASTDAGDIVGTMPNRGTFNLGLGVSVPAGYYSGGITANGKRWASGQQEVLSGVNFLSISGLGFKPSIIVAQASNYRFAIYFTDFSPTQSSYVSSMSAAYVDTLNGSTTYVRDGEFSIKVQSTATYKWIAFE